MSSAFERDHAEIGRDQTGDHVEDRGLAGAVGAEQPDGLALAQIEAGLADDIAPATSSCAAR